MGTAYVSSGKLQPAVSTSPGASELRKNHMTSYAFLLSHMFSYTVPVVFRIDWA